MDSIRFGTSGWRGIIAQDFTFANVTLVAQAIATYLKRELKRKKSPIYGRQPKIILGHDTRFMGPEFTRTVAEVLAENGLQPLMCQRDAPTPVIAHAIRQKRAMAGINMTASHNPAAYQGLKLSMHNGAGASQKVTQAIEREIVKLQRKEWLRKTRMESGWQCRTFDPKEAYFKQIRSLIDFKKIKRAKMKVAVECMYGTGRGYLDALLEEAGAAVTLFHDTLNPSFGGHHPEPNAEGMAEVIVAKHRNGPTG
ncbi:MAG: phosphoglucomutase/phosphomannomutase family protein, partial [Limisphaerales bacterium]